MARRRGSSGNWKFLLGIALGVIPLVVAGGVPAEVSGLVAQDSDADPSVTAAGDRLDLDRDEAQYISRVFTERSHEIAYCGDLSGEDATPVLTLWLADTVEATSDSVSFTTENCPPEMDDVLAHTHPSGNLGLSRRDRNLIQRRDETITCVQGGAVEVAPGEPIDNIACYQQVNETTSEELELKQLHVVLDDGGTGGGR